MEVINELGRRRMNNVRRIALWTIAVPIIVLAVGISGCEARKTYYDSKVRKLCESEGGVTVYERLSVSPDVFVSLGGNEKGGMGLPSKLQERRDIPAYQEILPPVFLKEGFLRVARLESRVIRWSDSKVLGRVIHFSRGGGDFPFSGSHPSHFQCPTGTDLVRQILTISENPNK